MADSTGSGGRLFGKDKLDELGLERVDAYVHIDRVTDDVLKASKDKREQRQKRCDLGLGQYVVWVPNDKDSKKALKAVADAVVTDRNVGTVIQSIISSAALLELFKVLSTSEPEVSSIVEMAKRGDLTALAALNATNPTLLQAISELTHSDDEVLSALNGILGCMGDPSVNAREGWKRRRRRRDIRGTSSDLLRSVSAVVCELDCSSG